MGPYCSLKPLALTSSHEAQRLSLIERRLGREWCSRLTIGFECDRGREEGRLDLHFGRCGVLGDAKLDETRLEVLVNPAEGWLGVGRLLHPAEEAEVVEEADKLGRLLVPETVAPRVLDKRELAVDPLADL